MQQLRDHLGRSKCNTLSLSLLWDSHISRINILSRNGVSFLESLNLRTGQSILQIILFPDSTLCQIKHKPTPVDRNLPRIQLYDHFSECILMINSFNWWVIFLCTQVWVHFLSFHLQMENPYLALKIFIKLCSCQQPWRNKVLILLSFFLKSYFPIVCHLCVTSSIQFLKICFGCVFADCVQVKC